jgi:hypothetical protein
LHGMLPEKLRVIVEEHRFASELAALLLNARRADEFIDGAKWVLSRDPFKGKRISTSNVWFLPIAEIPESDENPPGILPVVLYYTFDDDYVNFLSIQETVYPPKE